MNQQQKPIGLVISTILTAVVFVLFPGRSCAEWLPFSIERGHIYIDVEINGIPSKAILDSGSSVNMIDTGFLEQHGEDFHTAGKIRIEGVNSTELAQLYSNIPLSIYGVELTMNQVVARPLRRAEFLIGEGFFSEIIVQIDYPNSRLRFLSRGTIDWKKHANVPIKRASNSILPAIEVRIEGEKTWLLLDTGNNGGVVLDRSFATLNGLIDESAELDSFSVSGANRMARFQGFKLDSVIVGPYELENVEAAIPAQGQSSNLGMEGYVGLGSRIRRGVETNGLIGFDVLKHFVVTIDYSKHKLNLYAP